MRARKIRLHLTPEQKAIFKKWLGATRFVYNMTINRLQKIIDKKERLYINFLKKQIVTNVPKSIKWLKEVPQGLRAEAFSEAVTAFFANLKKAKETGKAFKMKFRTKKDNSQSGILVQDSLKEGYKLYPSYLEDHSQLIIDESEKQYFSWINIYSKDDKTKILKTRLSNSLRLQYTRTGDWYLCAPLEIKVPKIPENQEIFRSMILDPGVRAFMTGYSPDGRLIKVGENDIKKIRNYCLKTDKLVSIISKLKGKPKRRCRKALLKRYQQIRNWIKDCHRKLVKHLVDNYDIIMLPSFQVQNMSKRDQRKINSSTVRNMITWSHYKFRMMLITKAQEYPNKHVIVTTEEYTSKTCTRCGYIKNNLGGNKVFKCDKCQLVIDRDLNGSRNILIKYLTMLYSESAGACPTLGPLLVS